MTKETFIKILENNDILWNDLVTITIINPFRKIWEFWKPKILNFNGALGFTYEDDVVGLCVENPDEVFKPITIYFNFEQIIGINKTNKKTEPQCVRNIQKMIMKEKDINIYNRK